MRNDQPVTQHEHDYPDDFAIVSRTNEKGLITFVNDDFVASSGYSRAELVGPPHHMVRHPDMPVETFRDMWATLQSGRTWTGVVKNRRNNGDHYWVKATATPTPDGGYMSVRVKPTRAEVSNAVALYRRMRDDAGIRLSGGLLAPTGLFRLWQRVPDLKLSPKLWNRHWLQCWRFWLALGKAGWHWIWR